MQIGKMEHMLVERGSTQKVFYAAVGNTITEQYETELSSSGGAHKLGSMKPALRRTCGIVNN